MNWYLAALKKYATFSGRARRSEYWYFVVFNTLIFLGLVLVDVGLGFLTNKGGLGFLGGIYNLAMLVPTLAVFIRRLHDTNRSAWWVFIALIPIIGWIVILIFMFQDSQPGTNDYGPNPKEGVNALSGGISVAAVLGIVGGYIAVIGALVAAVAIPAYQDYKYRVAAAEAIGELASFRVQFADLVKRNDPTTSLANVGIVLNNRQHFGSLYYDPATRTLVGKLVEPFQGKSIGMQYKRSTAGAPELICGSKNLEPKYLPRGCRNEIGYLDDTKVATSQPVASATRASQPITEAKAPSVPQLPTASITSQPVASAVLPSKIETSQPHSDAPAVASPSMTERETNARGKNRAKGETPRQVAPPSKQEETLMVTTKESTCVYKAVMTDEEIDRCRRQKDPIRRQGPQVIPSVTPSTLASGQGTLMPHTAKPECVYKVVMTDEEIDNCR